MTRPSDEVSVRVDGRLYPGRGLELSHDRRRRRLSESPEPPCEFRTRDSPTPNLARPELRTRAAPTDSIMITTHTPFPEVRVGDPVCHEALSVFPLYCDSQAPIDYRLAIEAIEERRRVSQLRDRSTLPPSCLEADDLPNNQLESGI